MINLLHLSYVLFFKNLQSTRSTFFIIESLKYFGKVASSDQFIHFKVRDFSFLLVSPVGRKMFLVGVELGW